MNKNTPAPPDDDKQAEEKRRYHHTYWQRYRQRKKRLHVTLNPEEYAEFEARAREGKRKVWQQIVAEAQAYAIGRELPSTDTETEIRHLRSELRRIGNNINQIARQMNRGRGLDADELRADFAELERIIMDYVEGSHRAAGSPPPDEEESG